MASAYPDLFAAVGVHSGLACGVARDLPSALTAMRQGPTAPPRRPPGAWSPTIVFHGDKDGTVQPANGDPCLPQALVRAGLRSEVEDGKAAGGLAYSRTRLSGLRRPGGGARALDRPWRRPCLVGGSPDGSYTDPRGPDASREMLRFFLAHRRDAGSN